MQLIFVRSNREPLCTSFLCQQSPSDLRSGGSQKTWAQVPEPELWSTLRAGAKVCGPPGPGGGGPVGSFCACAHQLCLGKLLQAPTSCEMRFPGLRPRRSSSAKGRAASRRMAGRAGIGTVEQGSPQPAGPREPVGVGRLDLAWEGGAGRRTQIS